MTVTSTLPAPDGVAELGACIEFPISRDLVSPFARGTLASGVWTVTLSDPPAGGDYLIVWSTPPVPLGGRCAPEPCWLRWDACAPPAYQAILPLHFVPAKPLSPDTRVPGPLVPSGEILPSSELLPGAGEYVSPGLPQWAPDPDSIAALCSAYTRRSVGGYATVTDPERGRETGHFTEDTTPTLAQVWGYIAGACGEVIGRVGVGQIPTAQWTLAATAASWHAAASVEAKRKPAGTDDADGLYRAFIANYRASLDELVKQARSGPMRLH